ncbi:MAG: SCP2 sterol-binding domain-containing protein [Pseudonocardiaceae bacterium]
MIRGPRRWSVNWNVAEVALHLSQAWLGIPGLARGDLSAVDELIPDRAAAAGDSLVRDIADLGDVTTRLVQADAERDLGALADRIEARAKEYFADCARQSPEELRPWLLAGVNVALAVFTCHLLNETVVHGYDIARAAGQPWRINPAHAIMLMDRFFIPVIQGAPPRAMVNPHTAAGVRASFDVRIRGGDRFYFVFDDGTLRVETPSAHRVDCHLSADPVAFLLVFWRRQSQWTAIAKGQLMAWGRKPWLAPRFRSLLASP